MQRAYCWSMMVLTLWCCAVANVRAQQVPEVQLGLVKSLFRDVSPSMIGLAAAPFNMLIREQAGVQGKVTVVEDALELGTQIHQGKTHLGVFHGFEFAWAQQRHPDLKPLVIIVNRHRQLSANLVVRHDNPARSLADLKGASLGIPQGTREHCHLYVERLRNKASLPMANHFGSISRPPSKPRALDDLVRGNLQCVLVDGVSLDRYQEFKPNYHEKVKVLLQSEVFPAAVVAYRPGTLPDSTVQRLRAGLLQAATAEGGREMMILWGITAFELPPDDYQQTLNTIRTVYPPPTTLAQPAAAVPAVKTAPTN